MAAVVGFGGLAAATYAGHTATTSVVGGASGSGATSTAASGGALGSSGVSIFTAITPASGRGAHVTTGGS
jgi:hypothetical protein